MSRKKKLSIIAGILILLYSIAGFLVIPMIAESILPEKLNQHLNRGTEIKNIYFNPFTLVLAIEGLEIQEKTGDENLVSFDRFLVNLQWSSIFKPAIVARELRLENPVIRVTRLSGTEFNFSDLIPAQKDEQRSEPEETGMPLTFFISNITLADGRFVFKDAPMDKTHSFSDINFTIPEISNFDINTYSEPSLKGKFNEAELQVETSTKPFADSLKTVVDISISGVSLPRYFDYVPGTPGFSVSGGTLDVESSVSFRKDSQGQSRTEVTGTADFSDIKLAGTDSEEILSVPSIHVKLAPSDPLNKNIHIETLALTRPVATIVRGADGGLNLENPGAADKETQQEKQAEKNGDKDRQAPFILEMDNFELDSGTIRFRDFAAPAADQKPGTEPVEIQVRPVHLKISDFSSQSGHRADLDLSATLDTNTSLSVTGNFSASPLASDLDIKLNDLDLTLAQPYFPEPLHVVLSNGSLALAGNAELLADPDEGIDAHFTGNADFSELSLEEEKTGRPLTKLQSFDLNGIDVTWKPAEIELEEISVAGLEQQIAVEEDGGLNLTNLYEKEPPEKQHEETGESKEKDKADDLTKNGGIDFPVRIGEVKLADLAFLFTDNNIRSGYSTTLAVKEGSIKGLSTEAFKGAETFLECAVDEHAPLNIAGTINPLLEEILLDLEFNLGNLELAPLSHYAGKYIGRGIEKGKLNLDLDYTVENRELEAENQIVLDQFSLGERIESKDALNLPVGLAVALLKDRKGIIDLNLPVSGRLDDPEFSLTGIIFQALKNILVKAASSPFSLIGSIIKGGEEVRYIEFNAGSDEITDTALEKINSIQTLLYERPELKIELTGYVDPRDDQKALAERALEQRIRKAVEAERQRIREAEKEEPKAEDLSPDEKVIRKLYKKEVLSGPDVPGDAKPLADESLTIEEMKEKIRQQIEIDDKELHLLAQKRTKAVKDFILKDERIEESRLFLREAESMSPPEPEEFKESRVQLGLR
ncbi:MAG: DUF748 domain-containing protein [Desulfobacterales bacterium]